MKIYKYKIYKLINNITGEQTYYEDRKDALIDRRTFVDSQELWEDEVEEKLPIIEIEVLASQGR